ncbi:hypothetical protein FJR11_04455 [Anabaena sp. UHCC 0187]|uniref:hypothetical protein n=1 Tax=Anabaena sp. UHCC 0187 TaxID=2590018 RepID=UPI0014474F01|nr:hypothetical protein [Anabaena sp. UHCC 0187]MDP5016598.1 hypothetical protein [Dolichospermum sp.]MTJ11858.1 hypothetical protein [Anabaena sp. UHCC 0187]
MDSVNLTHQQLSQAINELPLAALPELADFIEDLRFKLNLTSAAINNEQKESNFLLSISGIGESSELYLSDKDAENLAPEIEPARGIKEFNHEVNE